MKKIIGSLLLLGFVHLVKAQTIQVGLSIYDESLRSLQLENKLDLQYSLSSRPFFTNKTLTTDSITRLIDNGKLNYPSIRQSFFNRKAYFEILPVSYTAQFNSHHPYGWNRAGFIDARGLQQMASTGIYASIGFLSIQLKPELVYAGNPGFEYSSQYGAPTRGAYHRVLPGQSSIRLHAGPISAGISTENMWWGPGIQNSLLMSNNAPGFLHLVLNTTRPIKTPVGNFEFQLIAAKLTEDTSVLLQNKDLRTPYYAQGAYGGEPAISSLDLTSWRYMNGLSITYNPKWVKGLFLGFNRLGYTYHDYLGEFPGFVHTYLPVFVGLFRSSGTYAQGSKHLKQTLSVFGRYVFLKAHAECYFEYGSNDNTHDQRDLIMSPDHGSAYTVGFKKMIPLEKTKWVDVQAEITQLAQSAEYVIRSTGYWYLYNGGYTNQSRIIGSGYGMGSNMQTVNLSVIDGFNKKGLIFQRIVHDPNRIVASPNFSWLDLSAGFYYQRSFKNLQFSWQTQLVNSSNYAWLNHENRVNLYSSISLLYLWKR